MAQREPLRRCRGTAVTRIILRTKGPLNYLEEKAFTVKHVACHSHLLSAAIVKNRLDKSNITIRYTEKLAEAKTCHMPTKCRRILGF